MSSSLASPTDKRQRLLHNNAAANLSKLPFEAESYYNMSSSSASPSKRRRLLRRKSTTFLLTRLPFETILGIASFLTPSDALNLACQKGILGKASESHVYWKQIARNVDPSIVPEEIVTSLISTKPRMKMPLRVKKGVLKSKILCEYALSRSRVVLQKLTDAVESGVPYPTTLWTQYDPGKWHLPPDRYHPKPLGAYSFLLEMERVGPGENKKCTVFLENIETDSELDDKYEGESSLRFRIPDGCLHDYFPWAEDYEDELNEDRICELDTAFTVYAIDRSSGKHAKIYHSGRTAKQWEYWEFVCQQCGPSTANMIPYLRGFIKDPWKEGEYGGLKDKTLELQLLLSDHDIFEAIFDDDSDVHMSDYETIGEDILLFLEKGNVYV